MSGGRRPAAAYTRDVNWTSKSRQAAGSLFERLVVDDEDMGVPAAAGGVDALLRSIKRNLDRALNVHAGGAAANPRFGMIDFCDSTVSSSDIAHDAITAIRDCILLADPRISAADVRHMPDPDTPLSLKFSVVCSIDVADAHEQMRIDMVMRDGRFCQDR